MPKVETNNNAQLVGQQNPGWKCFKYQNSINCCIALKPSQNLILRRLFL